MKRRLFALALALLLAVSLPVSALAATWYLEDGNITVSATENGQYVSQGGNNVRDDDPTITQKDSSKETGSTIKIETTGDATADVTIENVNISSDGDAIDVGSSSADITLKGDNKLFSETGSALHVSSGDVTIDGDGSLEAATDSNSKNAQIGSHENEKMSGVIHITGNATVTTQDDNALADDHIGGAGIGSGDGGDMSGSITIDQNAVVNASSNEDGAGIGSGHKGNMSGDIIIGGSAQVTARSSWDGAGIGAGDDGEMSGNITIGDSAQVTAWSDVGGAGIGSGEGRDVSGTITIGGSAQVTAGSDDESAGIGAGSDGSITSTGKIIIRDSAKVTAIGEDEGAGIGSGEDKKMKGTIIIQDNAQVTAIAGDSAAAIGSDDRNEMTGTIFIIGNARVTTGILDDDDVHFNHNTKEIEYTLDTNAIGRIGDGQGANHASSSGHYVIGPDVTINGISGSDIEALKQYVNMRLSGENHDGEPENLTRLDIRSENGKFTVDASGEGTVEKILYGGSETVPTAPGTYPVTCVVRLGNGTTLEFQIGTFIVPEPPAEAAQPAPVYHVTDKDGNQIPYTAAREGGVLTIRVDAAFARLTLTADEAQALTAQGVEKVVFITTGATSAFRPADLTAYKDEAPFVLTHDGETVTFTAGETDLASLLLQA